MDQEFLKKFLSIVLVVGCSALLSTAAWGTSSWDSSYSWGGSNDEDSDGWYYSWSSILTWSGVRSWTSSYSWGGDHDEDTDGHEYSGGDYQWGRISYHLHYSGCEHDKWRDPGSAIPEPTAALLFASGGLVLAQGIRKSRPKRN